jgi:hypothetical protein
MTNWETKIVKFIRERPDQSDSSLSRSLSNWLGNNLMSLEYFGDEEYSRKKDEYGY